MTDASARGIPIRWSESIAERGFDVVGAKALLDSFGDGWRHRLTATLAHPDRSPSVPTFFVSLLDADECLVDWVYAEVVPMADKHRIGLQATLYTEPGAVLDVAIDESKGIGTPDDEWQDLPVVSDATEHGLILSGVLCQQRVDFTAANQILIQFSGQLTFVDLVLPLEVVDGTYRVRDEEGRILAFGDFTLEFSNGWNEMPFEFSRNVYRHTPPHVVELLFRPRD